MAEYRAYIIGADGKIAKAAVEFTNADDETAKEYARKLVDGHGGVELWQGSRHVGTFKHTHE